MHTSTRSTPGCARGVSLIEALVALAVMSFGMLALIGVQSTMRINTDLSRQTSEASRLAATDLESTRLFVDVRHDDAQPAPSWDDLAERQATVGLPGDTGNVSFSLQRRVSTFPARPLRMEQLGLLAAEAKLIETSVTWTDRSNGSRLVRLYGFVGAASPSLSGMVIMPPPAGAPATRSSRHPTIPVSAQDLGNGKSALKPASSSNVTWVFDNTTGRIVQRCPSVTAAQTAITADTVASCPAIGNGSLVSGMVRFHLITPPSGGYTAAQAEEPQGLDTSTTLALGSEPLTFNISNRVNLAEPLSECFAGQAYVVDGGTSTRPTAIDYTCLIYAADSSGWGGRLDVNVAISGWGLSTRSTADATANRYRVCRYTRATSDYTANKDHPKSYCRVSGDSCIATNRVMRNLINQNFLVVSAGGLCPADSDNSEAAGQNSLRNANTLAHQP